MENLIKRYRTYLKDYTRCVSIKFATKTEIFSRIDHIAFEQQVNVNEERQYIIGIGAKCFKWFLRYLNNQSKRGRIFLY